MRKTAAARAVTEVFAEIAYGHSPWWEKHKDDPDFLWQHGREDTNEFLWLLDEKGFVVVRKPKGKGKSK